MWRARYQALKAILRPLWIRILAPFAVLYGTYDSTAHQFFSPETAEKFPTIYGLVTMTSGWFPWWVWLLIVVLIFFLATVEYVARSQHGIARTTTKPPSVGPIPDMPIHDLFFHIRADLLEHAEQRHWETVARDVMDRFSTGQLKVWGRAIGAATKRGGALVAIDQDYWANRSFTYHFLQDDKGIGMRDGAEIPHTYCYERGHAEDVRYGDLQVNRSQAFGIWPQRFKEIGIKVLVREPRRGEAKL